MVPIEKLQQIYIVADPIKIEVNNFTKKKLKENEKMKINYLFERYLLHPIQLYRSQSESLCKNI